MKQKLEMTILSIVCTKLLCTNAHLGRRVAYHHFKVYIRGSRNGIAILDSDKTLICLRNALHFIGSLSRQKGRFFFLKTNHLFYLEIMEEMVSNLRSYFRNVNSHCFDDSQWKIGAFLTNSFGNKKKFHSRKKKILFGLNQQPDCVVILNADRKSSVILEADRSQIPMVSLGDSTIPWFWYKVIPYTIPTRDTIESVYSFCHLIMKTVIMFHNPNAIRVERKRINSTFAPRAAFSSASSPKGEKSRPSYYWVSWTAVAIAIATVLFSDILLPIFSCIEPEQVLECMISLSQSFMHVIRAIFDGRERCPPLGGTEPSPSRSGEETPNAAPHTLSCDDASTINQPVPAVHQEGPSAAEASVNQPAPAVNLEGPSASETSVNSRAPVLDVDLNVLAPEIDLNQPASEGLDPASPVQELDEPQEAAAPVIPDQPPASPPSSTNSVVGSNPFSGESTRGSVAKRN